MKVVHRFKCVGFSGIKAALRLSAVDVPGLKQRSIISAKTLSKSLLTLQMEGSMPASASRSMYLNDRYWLSRSLW